MTRNQDRKSEVQKAKETERFDWFAVGRAGQAFLMGACFVGALVFVLFEKFLLLSARDLDTSRFALLSILPCAVGAFVVVYFLQDKHAAQFDFKIFGCSFKGKGGATVLWIAGFVALMAIVIIAARTVGPLLPEPHST